MQRPEEIAVVRPDQQAQKVGHDDTDEADAAADGHGSASRPRDCQDCRIFEALDRHAEMVRRGLAERQGVEATPRKGSRRHQQEGQ